MMQKKIYTISSSKSLLVITLDTARFIERKDKIVARNLSSVSTDSGRAQTRELSTIHSLTNIGDWTSTAFTGFFIFLKYSLDEFLNKVLMISVFEGAFHLHFKPLFAHPVS